MQKLYKQIALLASQLGAKKVVLYGSRARGDHRETSDIDIAIFDMPKDNHNQFRDQIDDLKTLLAFDILFVKPTTDSRLMYNIEKEGKVLMEKRTKLENLKRALERLKKAVDDYDEYHLESIRDGVIQRFEFTAELAWKACREYLLDLQYADIKSPKATMRAAYSEGIIKDEGSWIDLLQDRNLTSHDYDEEVAEEIFMNVRDKYIILFEELIRELQH